MGLQLPLPLLQQLIALHLVNRENTHTQIHNLLTFCSHTNIKSSIESFWAKRQVSEQATYTKCITRSWLQIDSNNTRAKLIWYANTDSISMIAVQSSVSGEETEEELIESNASQGTHCWEWKVFGRNRDHQHTKIYNSHRKKVRKKTVKVLLVHSSLTFCLCVKV